MSIVSCETSVSRQIILTRNVFARKQKSRKKSTVHRLDIISYPLIDYDNTEALPAIFDVHWYAGSAASQVQYSPFAKVALREKALIIWPDGMSDSPGRSGSWNVSSTIGPKGPICDLNREAWPPLNECFESCPLCDATSSCDWTTCYDDLAFLDFVVQAVKESWCLDLDHMHMTGISNGGMLLWNIAAYMDQGLGMATFNTIAASPQLGFAYPPDSKATGLRFSLIDMHGLEDITIPSNLETAFGPSPQGA